MLKGSGYEVLAFSSWLNHSMCQCFGKTPTPQRVIVLSASKCQWFGKSPTTQRRHGDVAEVTKQRMNKIQNCVNTIFKRLLMEEQVFYRKFKRKKYPRRNFLL